MGQAQSSNPAQRRPAAHQPLHNSLRSQWLLQVSGRDRSLLQHERRSRRGMAGAGSGRQRQHSRDGESWIGRRGGACNHRVPEDPLRWLHAQEVGGKLQSAAMRFPKALMAAITITDNAGDSPQLIALSGTGYNPTTVSLSATSLSFGSEKVGTATVSQSVTLTNTGGATLLITSIGLTGADASSFVFANTCGSSLAAGANCTIHGHFAPTAAAALTAAVTITDSATGSPQSIALSGTGN